MLILKDTTTGKLYKTKGNNPLNAKVKSLPHSFVQAGIITEEEWNSSNQTINEKLGNRFEVYATGWDGRLHAMKRFPYFTWSLILNS